MNAQEYVSKALKDKKFLADIISNATDDAVREFQVDDAELPEDGIAGMYSVVLSSAAPAMGVQASDEEIAEACRQQVNATGFKGFRILMRLGKPLSAEAKKRGIKK